MRPSEALALHRAELVRVAVAHGARNVRVFGSVLRGEDTEASDLDLLVDVPPGTSLLDMARLQQEIEAAIGVRVEVLTPNDLPERIRGRVLGEARPV
jgi:predicted nucleotidyltransferase